MQLRFDKSEYVLYNKADFPVYIRAGILSHYPNYSAESHWHDDIEFIVILDGHMNYNVNGKIFTLQKGDGLFVNSRQFHYGFSPEYQECFFICILLHPMLLCSTKYVEQKFILPVTTGAAIPYYKFSAEHAWERQVLEYLRAIYECRDSETMELKSQSLFGLLWAELYTHMRSETSYSASQNHHLTSLQKMISFLQNHYKEKIHLAEICKVGNVGKTTCSTIFMQYTNQTPIEYLTDFRLRKSIDFLLSTDMTISEIGYETGFSNASYFAETFHKWLGCSPGEYRKKHIGNTSDKGTSDSPFNV